MMSSPISNPTTRPRDSNKWPCSVADPVTQWPLSCGACRKGQSVPKAVVNTGPVAKVAMRSIVAIHGSFNLEKFHKIPK